MTQQHKLTWNPTQLKIKELLDQSMPHSEICTLLKVSPYTVTKVSSALKHGQTPADKFKKTKTTKDLKKQVSATDVKKAVNNFKNSALPPENQNNEPEDGQNEGENSGDDSGNGDNSAKNSDSGIGNQGNNNKPPGNTKDTKQGSLMQADAIASLMKMISVPVTCILTPMMMNARFIAIRELGWREDMPWENFFDTCLYYLFDAWGYTLQGYYKKTDEEIEAQAKALEGVSTENKSKVNGNGNGHNEEPDEDVKIAAALVAYLKKAKAK